VVHVPVNLEAHIVVVASEEVAKEGGTIYLEAHIVVVASEEVANEGGTI
jgi:hypothetical protein